MNLQKKIIYIVLGVVFLGILGFIGYSYFYGGNQVEPVPTVSQPSNLFPLSHSNIKPDAVADLGDGRDFIYFNKSTNSIEKLNPETSTVQTLASNILASSETIYQLLLSPNQIRAIIVAKDSSNFDLLVRYVYTFSTKSKVKLPPLEGVLWKNDNELIDVVYDQSGQKLNIFSFQNNTLVKSFPINDLSFDRLVGYDSGNQLIYFTVRYIPAGFEAPGYLPDSVSVMVADEKTSSVRILKDNLSPLSLAFFGDSVFYESETSVNKLNVQQPAGTLFYNYPSEVPTFNIESCDGNEQVIYCVNGIGTSTLSLVKISSGTNRFDVVPTTGNLFVGKVNLINENPLAVVIYDEFSQKLIALCSTNCNFGAQVTVSPTATATTTSQPSGSLEPSPTVSEEPSAGGWISANLISIILVVVLVAGLATWVIIRRRNRGKAISISLP